MIEFTLWDIVRNLLLAARWTVVLSLIAFIGGATVGLVLTFMRLSSRRWLQHFTSLYVDLFQGTPLLMQLFLIFFGAAAMGHPISAWWAASIALTLFTSAFLCDIWRGCLEAVAKGQWHAARVLSLIHI